MAVSKGRKHRAPHRRWPLAEKRRIVELTLGAGASARAIAREHGVHPNTVGHWKALYRAGKLETQPAARIRPAAASATFVPVSIAPAVRRPQRTTSRHDADAGSSVVQVVLASGAMLRIESGGLDAALVCALVAELGR
jgi:transposase-like protein